MLTVGITAIACETQAPPVKPGIISFEECVNAGYAVMESYPRQCNANGKTFIEEITDDELSKTIQTRAGDLSLAYKDGTAILSGILQRSTPCVNWTADIISTADFPISNVNINIYNANFAVMCIQVVGEPQDVEWEINQVSENTNYHIKFEDKVIFSGKLN